MAVAGRGGAGAGRGGGGWGWGGDLSWPVNNTFAAVDQMVITKPFGFNGINMLVVNYFYPV